MITVYSIFGQLAPRPNVETDLYTTPVGLSSVLRSINITNVTDFADTFDIAIVPDTLSETTNADYIFKSHTILPHETITVKGGYTMEEGNTIRVLSNNGTSTFSAFGGEF